MARAVVVMGVSGCGKSTVGRLLAGRLGWAFADADAYHPPANIAKMSEGIPLDDADRLPWLERLRELLVEHLERGESIVLACSALKASYRALLQGDDPRVQFVYLRGSSNVILERLESRKGHYMRAQMLASQFRDLEEPGPDEALIVDITEPPSRIVDAVERALGGKAAGGIGARE